LQEDRFDVLPPVLPTTPLEANRLNGFQTTNPRWYVRCVKVQGVNPKALGIVRRRFRCPSE
jgi:hypothetical protein